MHRFALPWGGLLALVSALALLPEAQAAPAPGRPNIVLIMSDDMGYSDLGCYGGEIHTPNLDQLAAGGLRFTQFYNTARCCPTRASLLTGLYPHQAEVGHMTGAKHAQHGYEGDLSRNAVTIAEVLRTAGYATCMVGKWHVTKFTEPEGPRHNWPLQRGFDRFYGTIAGGGNFYDPTTLCRGNQYITPVNDAQYRPERFYYTDAISDNAVQFLDQHAKQKPQQPLFMYVAYTAAHWPMHAPEEEIAKYQGRYDCGYGPIRQQRYQRLKELGLIDPRWELSPQAGDWDSMEHKAWEARCMEVYAAMVTRMDAGIGRIVATLRQLGRLDNTLVFFLQDNGACAEPMGRQCPPAWRLDGTQPMGPDELQARITPPMRTRDGRAVLGGPEVMPGPADTYIGYGQAWANVSNTPFREYKHWVHEGGISTPLIAHWPAGIPRRGEFERQPGHLIDIMATCVDVAQATYPQEFNGNPIKPLPGRSLVPAFSGQTIQRDAIYWEHEGNRAIRVGPWKLVAKHHPQNRPGPSARPGTTESPGPSGTGASNPRGDWELYDIQSDRSEMHDLAAQQPDRVQSMAQQWETWARSADVVPWPWGPPYGPDKPGPAKKKPQR